MKNKIYLVSTLLFGIMTFAQVGVGTTTPAGALDISSTTNGFIPPRVVLSATNIAAPVVNPQGGGLVAGTIVWNTATAGAAPNNVSPGLYYWDGTRWVSFAGAAGGLDWSLNGNSGTTVGTNFLGTTDVQDFTISTNNSRRLTVSSTGDVSIGTNAVTGDNVFEVTAITTDEDAISGYANGNGGLGVYGSSTLGGVGTYGFNNATGIGSLGLNNSTGIGSYGINNNTTANQGGFGAIGSITASTTSTGTGVQGQADSPTATGVVALNLRDGIGLYAQATGGTLSTGSNAAVYASLTYTGANSGNQDVAAVIGSQSNNRQTTGGAGYAGPLAAASPSALAGVAGTFASKETNANNDSYFFGVIGDVLRDSGIGGSTIPDRTGGVLGYNGSNAWGVLGYRNSTGTTFSVYGAGQNGSIAAGNGGRSSSESIENNHIGIGISGGFMGGYINGNQYGTITKGKEFGMYVDGNTITNNPIVQLSESNNQRVISYTSTSTTVDVSTRGKAKLSGGESFVAFDKSFKSIVSKNTDDINITITPTGATNGVYISKVTTEGFYVKENLNGTSNASFNWVAIGTKNGFENGVEISDEILSNNFDKNMNDVMFNDGDTKSEAKPIYFDGNKIRFERMKEDTENQKKSLPAIKKEAVHLDNENVKKEDLKTESKK
jgi:hypothetical protein